jgi:hypothetical protein
VKIDEAYLVLESDATRFTRKRFVIQVEFTIGAA